MKINRRKLLSLIGVSPAILAGSPALADDKKKKPAPVVHGQEKIEVLNPKGMPPAVQLVPMAPRLANDITDRRCGPAGLRDCDTGPFRLAAATPPPPGLGPK